jgi:hypothetical protein
MIWITRRKPAGWTVWFPPGGIADLVKLPGEMRRILEKRDFADKVTARLFPQAYRDDPEAEAEYQRLLRDDLLGRKLEAVDAFERTLRARKEKSLFGLGLVRVDLGDEDLTLWLGFLHDMRLVVGTRLDITDETWERGVDPEDPNADELLLLHRLAFIEEAIIGALRETEKLE